MDWGTAGVALALLAWARRLSAWDSGLPRTKTQASIWISSGIWGFWASAAALGTWALAVGAAPEPVSHFGSPASWPAVLAGLGLAAAALGFRDSVDRS